MGDQPILEPIEERHIDFYGDDVTAVLVPLEAAPQIYVPVRALCDYLGLSWSGQRERILRDPVMSEAVRSVRVTRTERGERDVLALPLDVLPGWLFGISAARVREELRDKIIRYQRECFRVLWEAFKHDIVPTTVQPPIPTASTALTNAEMTLETLRALTHLAEQQVAFERKYDADMAGINQRMDNMGRFLLDAHARTDERLAALELRLSPDAPITDEQAGEISLAVKNVAAALEATGTVKNAYQRVYAELYRRESTGSYKNIRQGRYQAVLDWLHQWHQEVAGEVTGT
jgi:hypothetical protein